MGTRTLQQLRLRKIALKSELMKAQQIVNDIKQTPAAENTKWAVGMEEYWGKNITILKGKIDELNQEIARRVTENG